MFDLFVWVPTWVLKLPPTVQRHASGLIGSRTTNQMLKYKMCWNCYFWMNLTNTLCSQCFLMTVTVTSTIACSCKYQRNVIEVSVSIVVILNEWHHWQCNTETFPVVAKLPQEQNTASLWSVFNMWCCYKTPSLYMGVYSWGEITAIMWAVIINLSWLHQHTN